MDQGQYDKLMGAIVEIQTKIMEEDEHEKERFAVLNKHFDEVAHAEMVEAAEVFKNMKKMDGISISSLPKAIQLPLKAFDADGDNTISPEELMHGAELYKAAKDKSKVMVRIASFLGLLLVLMIGAIAGVTFAMIEVTKEARTADDGAMTPVSEDAGPAVSTGAASESAVLDSANGDFYFKHMADVTIGGFDGRVLSFKASGFYRQPCETCIAGSMVSVITDGGVLQVHDRKITFAPSALLLDANVVDDEWLQQPFYIWRRGPDAKEPTHVAEEGRRRTLLSADTSAQQAAEAAVKTAAGWSAMSTADLTTSAGSDLFYAPACPAKSADQDCFLNANGNDMVKKKVFKTYPPLSSKPYAARFGMTVPDHLSFDVWKGKDGWLGVIIKPVKGNGALAIPEFSWSGEIGGTMEIFNAAVKPEGGVQQNKQEGKITLKKGSTSVDDFSLKYTQGMGQQAAFMREINMEDLGAAYADTLKNYAAQASIFVEVMFNLPATRVPGRTDLRNSNSFTGISAYMKITIAAAMAGFEMQATAFEADMSWNDAENWRTSYGDFPAASTMSINMFGSSVSADRRRNLLAAGDSLGDQLSSGLDAMLTAMADQGAVHEGLPTLADAASRMRVRKYFDFEDTISSRSGVIDQAEGDAAVAAYAAFQDPDNADLVDSYLACATTTTEAEVIGAVASASASSAGSKTTKKKGKSSKKKKKK